jgi:hypothetical protein
MSCNEIVDGRILNSLPRVITAAQEWRGECLKSKSEERDE